MNSLSVKKGDNVLVLTGKDKGKKGTILACDPTSQRVIVTGINMQKKHVKAKNAQQTGGIIEHEGPISASNVMIICPKCDKATRVANEVRDGKKVRVCKHCGAELVFKAETKASKKAAKKSDDEKPAKKTTAKKTTKKAEETQSAE